MPLTEKPNTTDTSKKPRLYGRGNDQINLDDYIRNLESGFDTWLNSRRIKDKHREAVREAYREMVTRLNSGDGSLTSRLGGGFQDSTGKIRNADKGFDAYGVAASYLGNTLRGMAVYKEPEPTPDPSKIKYGDGALGTALTRRLLGSAGTIQDFIDRDPYDKDTRTRGNSVRSKDFRQLLGTTAADLRAGVGEFSDWTEDLRTKGASDLEGLFTIFDNDGQITDDEYLQLARVTGISDLRKMFATGEQTAPTVVAPDGAIQRAGRTYADKIRAILARWKPYTGLLTNPITIGKTDMSRLGQDASQKIALALNNASTQDLTGIIQDILLGKTLNTRFISKIFNGQNPFVGADEENVKNFLLTNAINLLNRKTADHNGGLHNFGESNLGAYYIAGTQTDRNTGFVYDDNNRTISEMSIHDIPYWQNYINNWWNSLEDSNYESDLDPTLTSIYKRKEGGVIFAKEGINLIDRNLGRGPGFTGNNLFLATQNTAENALNINTWDEYYDNNLIDNTIKAALEGDESVSRFWDFGYRVDDKGHTLKDNGKDLHGISASLLGIYLNELNQLGDKLSWEKILNEKGYEAWNRKFDQTGLNMFFGGDSDKFDFIGPSTWNRHKLLQRLLNTYNKDNPMRIGDDELYWNGSRWTMPSPESRPTPITTNTTSPDKSSIETKSIKQTPGLSRSSEVDETDTGATSPDGGDNFLNIAVGGVSSLLDIARLFASLRANKKIEEALQPYMALREPLNLNKGIFGKFPIKLNYHRYGAEAIAQAYRQADADADRNAARMNEAQKLNIESQIKGDLADDAAIKKDLDEQFNLNKWLLLYNRENAYEPNREKTADYKNTIGLIHASKLGKDWKGIDNFIAGIQGRIDNKRDALYDIAKTDALMEMENSIEPYLMEFRKWLSNPKNTDITKHPKYLDYLDAVKNSRNAYTKRVNQASLYYAKQGGTIKPKLQDFIAQIIKLNNERNS